MTSPWWTAFGPAETRVSCGSGEHLMRWTDGHLRAADHPDAEGEMVLAALGGDATPCLELASAWGKHSEDLAVLAIGPRSTGDKLAFSPEVLEQIEQARTGGANLVHGWGSMSGHTIRRRVRGHRGAASGQFVSLAGSGGIHSSRRTAPLRRPRTRPFAMALAHGGTDSKRAELIWLLTLGAPFQFRLSAAVAHAWSAEGRHASRAGQESPALTAALTGRVAPAAAKWLGVDPGVVDASIHDGGDWGAIEETRVAGERRVQARLPVSWLARVWAPGLAVVGGHLVVGVMNAAWPTADVLALPAPGKKPVELSIRHEGPGWITA